MTNLLEMVIEPLEQVFLKFQVFLPNFVAMLIILLTGIFFAWLVKLILQKFLKAVKFDSWSDRMGFTSVMRKGEIWAKPSVALGRAVFWLLVIVTVMISLSSLDYETLNKLIVSFFEYLPRVFTAVLILFTGYVLSGFISRAMLIAMANAGYHYAKLISKAARVLLMLMILAMSMEQLQIAPGIVLAAFSILFGGIVAALSIAFGVGGIDAARRVIEKESTENPKKSNKDNIEHI